MTTKDYVLWEYISEYMSEYCQWKPLSPDNFPGPTGHLYLWIDQICIDQSSVRERNHQVGMMASIYSGCSGTIVWLGSIHDYPDAPLVLRDLQADGDRSTTKLSEVYHALATVTRNEYFTRLWIVQEIILSTQRKVLCSHPTRGPVWIDWGRLLVEAQNYPHYISSKAVQHLLDDHKQEKQMTLIYAIKTFIQSHCQNPRDKVYGLMGLVKEEQRLAIDYGKSLQELLLDSMTVFYAEFAQEISQSCYEYRDTLASLGTSWGIMSASLDAFLYHTWLRPTYDWFINSGSKEYGYSRIRAMGFLPNALNQSITLQSPDNFLSGPLSSVLKSSEWIPTKDCWWYEVDGITYEIYGLISNVSGEKIWPNCYYKGVKQAPQQ